jgi:hypothetical protein
LFWSSVGEFLIHSADSRLTTAVSATIAGEARYIACMIWEDYRPNSLRLDGLELMDSRPESTSRHWRAVTTAASARLANRLNAGPHDRSFAEAGD